MEEQPRSMKAVWTVVERGPGKSFWTRIGVGFVNRDGSVTVKLDAIPVNGTLQVREWSDPQDRRPDGADGASRPRSKTGPSADLRLSE